MILIVSKAKINERESGRKATKNNNNLNFLLKFRDIF